MATKVRIKRSTTVATPSTLDAGELAYTSNGDILYIGSPDSNTVTAIGGKRNPGVLTANQALVVNSTSAIDKVIVANLVPQTIYANNGFGTANYVLVTPGDGSNVYWESASAVGGINVDASYTFSNTITFNGSVLANTVNASSFTTSNVTVNTSGVYVTGTVNSTVVSVGTDLVGNSSGLFTTGVVNGATLSVGTSFTANSTLVNAVAASIGGGVTANSSGIFPVSNTVGQGLGGTDHRWFLLATGIGVSGNALIQGTASINTLNVASNFTANSTRIVVANTVGLQANGTIGTANQVLRSDGTSIYWSDDVGDISGITAGSGLSGGGSSGDVTVSVLANNGVLANSSGLFAVAANGISVDSSGINVNGGSTLTVNSTGAHVNSTLSITSLTTSGDLTVNGNTIVGSDSSDRLTINGLVSSNVMPSTNNTYHLGNTSVKWAQVHAANVHGVTGIFDGNVEIAGDLIVTGNVTTTNVGSLIVGDAKILLAANNPGDLLDIGFSGTYTDGGSTVRHAGLFRDASDNGQFKFFANTTQDLTGNNVVNTSATGYTLAVLQTYLVSGGLTTNSTSANLTANSTYAVGIVANSLTLSVPLAGTSGGTGLNSYTAEDILVANSSNGFRKLAFSTTDGHVLQSNGSALVYDHIDGGTF